jgi:hypothetical protein
MAKEKSLGFDRGGSGRTSRRDYKQAMEIVLCEFAHVVSIQQESLNG